MLRVFSYYCGIPLEFLFSLKKKLHNRQIKQSVSDIGHVSECQKLLWGHCLVGSHASREKSFSFNFLSVSTANEAHVAICMHFLSPSFRPYKITIFALLCFFRFDVSFPAVFMDFDRWIDF